MTRHNRRRADPAAEAFAAADRRVRAHPLFAALSRHVRRVSGHEWADITPNGTFQAHPTRHASEDEWVWVFAHCLLHLGFTTDSCATVLDFQPALKFGTRPSSWEPGKCVWGARPRFPDRWTERFAAGLSNAAVAAIGVAGGARSSLSDARPSKAEWDLALSWFVSNYPLLGGLTREEWRFVLAYDRITVDLRRYRKLLTLRGHHQGDLLGEPLRGPADVTDLLVEEIRALEHPPLPWDAQLARWFEEFVPAVEKRRTCARASRRQASTPDIPRPGRVRPVGKALGAIASYAAARDVPAARVVFCDAMAYDAGYVPVEDIAGRVTVRGRGGTVLQPGIDLLERASDFPSAGPVLIITDGGCDVLRIRREHAFLIPAGAHLPFRARGPVFRMS